MTAKAQSDGGTPRRKGDAAALDFEQALAQVEEIIARIESGEVGLERSIAEYERGAALVRRCREILQTAEQKVEDLTARMQAEEAAAHKGQRRPGRGPSGPGDDKDAPS